MLEVEKMRWTIKRPDRNHIAKDIEEVIHIMSLDRFIWFDVFIYSLIFCLLLSVTLPSLLASVLVFIFIFIMSSSVFLTCRHFFKPKEES